MKCRVYISLSRYGASLPTGCESASSRDEVMSALFSLSPGVALARPCGVAVRALSGFPAVAVQFFSSPSYVTLRRDGESHTRIHAHRSDKGHTHTHTPTLEDRRRAGCGSAYGGRASSGAHGHAVGSLAASERCLRPMTPSAIGCT